MGGAGRNQGGATVEGSASAIVTTTPSIFTPAVDLPNAVYIWTVRAHDKADNTCVFVAKQSFTINATTGIHLPIILKE